MNESVGKATFAFEVIQKDSATAARLGLLHTSHGDVQTPVFMPVGTAGAVKALPHEWLEDLDAQIILANTYHLYLRPGHDRIQRLGRMHRVPVRIRGCRDLDEPVHAVGAKRPCAVERKVRRWPPGSVWHRTGGCLSGVEAAFGRAPDGVQLLGV